MCKEEVFILLNMIIFPNHFLTSSQKACITHTCYGGQGACPLKLKHFDNFKLPVDQFKTFSFQNVNIPAHSTSKGFRGLAP